MKGLGYSKSKKKGCFNGGYSSMELLKNGYSYLMALLVLFSSVSILKPNHLMPNNNKPLHVIFDLNGVLLTTSKTSAMGQITASHSNFLLKAWADRLVNLGVLIAKQRKIKKKLYTVLNTIQPTGNDWGLDDPDGDILPGLMCDWMNGKKTVTEIRTLVLPIIKKNKQWFSSRYEQRLVYNLARMLFTPKKHADNVKVIESGLKFVRACKKKGYGVYVMSNWDAESITHVKAKYPELFALFDGVIISAEVGLVKPQPEIYQLFTNIFGAEKCVFIDDQAPNVKAATASGMHAIHCVPQGVSRVGDWKTTRKQFAHIEERLLITQETTIRA
jgi:HAD superfamily hydrolase (TIGR01509 family)